jgi:3-oxoadipate enol-lactonase
MTRVAVQGAELHTQVDASDRSNPPWIILSNSLAADHTMWDPQIPALTSRYRVLRYDTRGHGLSDAPSGPCSFDMLVGDVLALMDHYQIDKAAYMGLSLGGMTGLGLALTHPDRVERLVCCDARADAPEPFVKSWADRLAAVDRDGMRGILTGTMERWLTPRFRKEDPEMTAKVEAMILSTSVTGYKGCAEALKRLDYLKDLPRMRVPTLYVGGAEDAAAPPEAMEAMAKATPGARFTPVPDAAHIANIDNQPGFHAAVAEFLELA